MERARCPTCKGTGEAYSWQQARLDLCPTCHGTRVQWPLGLSVANGHRGWGTSDLRNAQLCRTREEAERRAERRRREGFPAWPVQLPWTEEQLRLPPG